VGHQRWAQDGQTWDWIVAHYYPGATLATPRPALAATLTGAAPTFAMASGDEMVVYLEYANDGSATWRRDQIFVGTTGPRDRASAFWKAENWLDPGRPTSVDAEVAPGAVGRFTWAMVAPEVDEPTTFVETFGLVTADGAWFGPADDAVAMTITVTPRETVDGRPEQGGCSAGGGDVGLVAMSLAVALAVASRRRRLAAIAAAAILGCAGPDAPTPGPRYGDAVGGPSELAAVFRQVASESGVPAEVLAALAYHETRLAMIAPEPDHDHGPAAWGVFALTEHDGPRGVARAAALSGLAVEQVRTDPLAHVRAGAALLAAHAEGRPTTLAGWRTALARFGGDGVVGAALADGVLATVARGARGVDDAGRSLTVTARPMPGLDEPPATRPAALGFPGARWVPAVAGNYRVANRGAADINYIVVHTTQGSYNGAISWFQNPAAEVSAHYVIRSSDGDLTQMVDDKDIAYHDACFNTNSIGIEHEGFVADPGRWYTEAMYMKSAAVTAWLCDAYGIPKDRMHIYGHGTRPTARATPIPARAGTGSTTWRWSPAAARRRWGPPPAPASSRRP
jgi:hypothetical protein